jgi:Trypsin-co-occurring domain 1
LADREDDLLDELLAPEHDILVHFSNAGIEEVSRDSERLRQLSGRAIANAMATVTSMAERVNAAVLNIDILQRPTQVEAEFGIELDTEMGALIARSSVRAAILVKLTWSQNPKAQQS